MYHLVGHRLLSSSGGPAEEEVAHALKPLRAEALLGGRGEHGVAVEKVPALQTWQGGA